MDTKNHGIKIGDLVKFKHHSDLLNIGKRYAVGGEMPVHLVTEVLALDHVLPVTMNIRLHGTSGITHRASAFVVVRRA